MTISRPYIFLWMVLGLCLTIGASFLPVYMTNSPLQWVSTGITAYPLGFKCQVGAVLLVGCLGGRVAGALTQIAYLLVGLLWLKVFNDGGGIEYLQKPAFGYLLAFIPGAWICGELAFRQSLAAERQAIVGTLPSKLEKLKIPLRTHTSVKTAQTPQAPQLEYLGFSCLCGLLSIHLFGIGYLVLFQLVDWLRSGDFQLLEAITNYSIYQFPSQLVLACVAASIAFILRRIMLY
jgi:biotin transport system substrate-specific component